MLKLDTKPGIIFSGIVSIGVTIAYLAAPDRYYYRMGPMQYWGLHICCLEILSSAVLIVGVLEQNYKLFVPWMISTALFIYLLTYATIAVIQTIYWIFVPIILAPSTVYLSYALYAVKKGFDTMRENQSEPKISVAEKRNILSHC